MNPVIWLRSSKFVWAEFATDEKGTLSISEIARYAKLLPKTLLSGVVLASEGTTIAHIRRICGSTAGESKDSAILVGGTAIPPLGVLFLAMKCYKMF